MENLNQIHTGKESLDICKILIFGIGHSNLKNENEVIIKALNKLMDYKHIGTRNMCRKWKEKSTPTLPDRIVINAGKDTWHVTYKCPDCNTHLIDEDITGFYNGTRSKFCSECGKAFLWEFT